MIKFVKYTILIGFTACILLLTIGLSVYLTPPGGLVNISSALKPIIVIFIGTFAMILPFIFYAYFGKVWINGIQSLEDKKNKLSEEIDKYIEERRKIQKWVNMQIEKDLNKKQ